MKNQTTRSNVMDHQKLYYEPKEAMLSTTRSGDMDHQKLCYRPWMCEPIDSVLELFCGTRIEDVEAENDRKIKLQGSHWRFN